MLMTIALDLTDIQQQHMQPLHSLSRMLSRVAKQPSGKTSRGCMVSKQRLRRSRFSVLASITNTGLTGLARSWMFTAATQRKWRWLVQLHLGLEIFGKF